MAQPVETPRCGGVVLCGGQSRRMGQPKLSLPFGNETLLERVVRILGEAVGPVAIVAAPDQALPAVDPRAAILRDEHPGLGPLAGMAVGLRELARLGLELGYVSACDTPLLTPAFIRCVVEHVGPHELAVPRDGDRYHPLAGVYRTSLVPRIESLLAAERLRPLFLIEDSDAVKIELSELRRVDPELDSLRNANTRPEYEILLRRHAGRTE